MVTTSSETHGFGGSGDFQPAELSENAKVVIERRIARRDDQGDAVETPDQVFLRVARNLAESKTRMNETGPLATPIVERTRSFEGRRRENEKPVPPSDLWMMAVFLTVSKMPSIESSTGRTKQAESCWRSRPAFTSVGEFGRKSSEAMSR